MSPSSSPIIALTANRSTNASGSSAYEVKEAYIRSVIGAGGLPVLLPTCRDLAGQADLLAGVDGVVLTGGGDVDPQFFTGGQHGRVSGVDQGRDLFEIALVRHLVQSGMPFLGICRGIQVVNVALGGDLVLDIADELPSAHKHDYFTPKYAADRLSHSVVVEKGSSLAKISGFGRLEVNSRHHQAIKQLAPGLKVSAFSDDGIIEAVELPTHPFGIAVQWHPENLQADPRMKALFAALVNASEAS